MSRYFHILAFIFPEKENPAYLLQYVKWSSKQILPSDEEKRKTNSIWGIELQSSGTYLVSLLTYTNCKEIFIQNQPADLL
jgi:hypothetical protein